MTLASLAPTVPVRAFLGRDSLGRFEVVSRVVRNGQQRGLDDVLWDSEERGGFAFVMLRVDRREG